MKFSPGDVVMLKSGSVPLTVVRATEEGIALTWYADTEETFHSAILPADCLVTTAHEVDDEDEEGFGGVG
ncbi:MULTISPECIES: hypothetical protein [unclassified Chelatococcus]|uniref:hypothetical protein n=1 Tax=unclassified Chelatococcus TaxID=2638111 RepID=UPI0002DE57E3|nr:MULTISPECIES: hypothetical protein [unclassified Chelatococcus]ALA16497.1 hypothetical protein AL346_02600 [Chelatococcus sp. CO-6]